MRNLPPRRGGRKKPFTPTLLAGLFLLPCASHGDWTLKTRGTLYYTDDVGIFSATRRLTRDGDPTQPAIDSRLMGQGRDGVFEPRLQATKSMVTPAGTSTLRLTGDGFVFFDHTRYSNGSVSVEGLQAFTPSTRIRAQYYYNPDLYLGNNVERRTGTFQEAPERVSSQIGLIRAEQDITQSVQMKVLARYGNRRYNQAYRQRDTHLWTLGTHLEWKVVPGTMLGFAYHYERGIANGHNQPQFEDDISYANNYLSLDADVELLERLSLFAALHLERNDWLSSNPGSERTGAFEKVIQGELLLVYRLTEASRAFGGVQSSSRKQSFEAEGFLNTNVGIGLQTEF